MTSLPAHRREARLAILVLVSICVLTFFTGLGTTALWEPDEPRFAEATRQMLGRRDFITPWFNDAPRFEKPILLYWLQLPFFGLFGATETAARAPAALSGLLAVLAVFGLVRRRVSTRAGLIAGAVLATTFRFVLYAREGLTDVPVVAAVTCALWAMTRGVSESSPRAVRLAWAAAGAGILLKGPVGLLAPVIWTVWAVTTGGRAALERTRPWSGVAIMAAIAAPWYVAMLVLHGRAFVSVALGYEVVARYMSPDFPGPNRGFFYYWFAWLGDALPWSIFLIPAFWWAYSRRRDLSEGEAQAMRLAAMWFVVILLVFSLSQYKLPHYILPAYPAMAIAIGVFANAAIDGRAGAALWRIPAVVAALALMAGAALVSLLMWRAFELDPRDVSFVFPALVAAGAIVVAVLALARGDTSPRRMFTALTAILAVCYGFLAIVVAPRELRRFQPVPILAAVARHVVAASEPLAVAGNYGAPGLVFYARHPVKQLPSRAALIEFLSGEGRRHCVLPDYELQAVQPQLKRPVRVQAEASVFSVRMRRLLERQPQRAGRVLVLVTVE